MGFVFFAFLMLQTSFYFLDPTLYVPKMVFIACSWVLVGFIALHCKFRFHPVFWSIAVYLCVLQGSKLTNLDRYGWMETLYPAFLVHVLFFLYFLSVDKERVSQIINAYITAVVLLCVPGIFIYAGVLMNTGLKYELLHLGGRSSSYRNYYHLAIIGNNEIFNFGRYTVARMGGAV